MFLSQRNHGNKNHQHVVLNLISLKTSLPSFSLILSKKKALNIVDVQRQLKRLILSFVILRQKQTNVMQLS